ncbi:hypothetical protein EI94DRAFT_70439 [Lactarius quietus]|nr:hypothetical protein EI94DRAFT_70439 [Lactarius quietus]
MDPHHHHSLNANHVRYHCHCHRNWGTSSHSYSGKGSRGAHRYRCTGPGSEQFTFKTWSSSCWSRRSLMRHHRMHQTVISDRGALLFFVSVKRCTKEEFTMYFGILLASVLLYGLVFRGPFFVYLALRIFCRMFQLNR